MQCKGWEKATRATHFSQVSPQPTGCACLNSMLARALARWMPTLKGISARLTAMAENFSRGSARVFAGISGSQGQANCTPQACTVRPLGSEHKLLGHRDEGFAGSKSTTVACNLRSEGCITNETASKASKRWRLRTVPPSGAAQAHGVWSSFKSSQKISKAQLGHWVVSSSIASVSVIGRPVSDTPAQTDKLS